MAQELEPSIAYLLSLKQGSQADVSPPESKSDPPQASPGTADSYQGTNKRRAARYKCEGSAELREEGCDVRTWATFTDISLYGCYVEAQATYPAGTILNMRLEANGTRVETRGNVRVNYPYLGMGIAFVGMTDENLQHLRQMLAVISRGPTIVGPGIPSSLPSTSSLGAVAKVGNPASVIQDLIDFFEGRQMLMREDFLRILRKSQTPQTKA
ncbi:MAG TPA: PilZ domain-containing protein [Candidatus Sulfotelmatobacter sp.]|nr:PilZ domain-containing protein [Candidatus Sulfotelmatobacter sp.]